MSTTEREEGLPEKLAWALDMQFGPFLAHDPHDPARFYARAVDALMPFIAAYNAKIAAEVLEEMADEMDSYLDYPLDDAEEQHMRTLFACAGQLRKRVAAIRGDA